MKFPQKSDLIKIVELRKELIETLSKLRDYRNNTNAIMKEVDHARLINETIVRLDEILKNHVQFK